MAGRLLIEPWERNWVSCPIGYRQNEPDYCSLNQFLSEQLSKGTSGFVFSESQQPTYRRLSNVEKENVIRFTTTRLKGARPVFVELKTETIEEAASLSWRFFNAGADAFWLNPGCYRGKRLNHSSADVFKELEEYVLKVVPWLPGPFSVYLLS